MKSVKKLLALLLTAAMVPTFCSCGKQDSTDVSSNGDSLQSGSSDSDSAANLASLGINVTSGAAKNYELSSNGKDNVILILVIGQSNMTTGVGYGNEFTGVSTGTDAAISAEPTRPAPGTVYSGTTVTSLSDAFDAYKLTDPSKEAATLGGFTPSIGATINQLTGCKVVFVQAAMGAVGMHEWVKNPDDYMCNCTKNGKGNLYSTAVSRYNATYTALKGSCNIVLTGYIWNQGEHEEVYNNNNTCSVHDAKTYYDAYKSMHDSITAECGLNFGSIIMVRCDKCSSKEIIDTAQGSMSLTSPRIAQYKICQDLDNCFLISRLTETCDISMMTKYNGGGIHYNQNTYNTVGADAGKNLVNSLGLGGKTGTYNGVSVYNKYGKLLCTFDKDGKVTAGSATIERNGDNSQLIAVPDFGSVGSNCKISITSDSKYFSSTDGYTAIFDWVSYVKDTQNKTLNLTYSFS